MDRLFAIVEWLAERIGRLFSYLFLICMAIIAYEVVMRYGVNAPTIWAHDVTTALCATGFLLSGLYTLKRRAHIRVSLVYEKLPAEFRAVLDVVNSLIILAFLGLLGYQSTKSAITSVSIGETAGTASQLPLPAIVKTALAAACILMFILALAQLIQSLLRERSDEPPAVDPT
ncbi:MAG: TRAP transporter small permease subunit [Alphaproteobacteria bacterium]|nr:TRAP transporter small permease subunit [Alphaproteobacteria bacterium]